MLSPLSVLQQSTFFSKTPSHHLIIIIIIITTIIIIITISKSFRKYVSTIPGNHDVRELQNTAILGTAHMLRKVLM
jgi:hypothetical protein